MDAPHPHAPAAADAIVRDATADDVARIVEVINSAYKPRDGRIFPGSRTDEDDIKSAFAVGGTSLIIAEVDGVVAACVRIEFTPPDAHFGPLATAIGYQRRGLAPRLITECEQRGREAGCATMHIGVIREVGLQPYYELLGYRPADETPGHELPWGAGTKQPFTLVHMTKDLT